MQSGNQQKNKTRAASKRAPDPLWVRALAAIYRFLAAFWAGAVDGCKRIFDFYKEFFTGLPMLFAYLHKKAKKKREIRRKRRQEEKELDRAERRELKREEKQAKALEKQEKRAARRGESGLFRRYVPVAALCAILIFEGALIGRYGTLYFLDLFGSRDQAVTMAIVLDKKDTRETKIPAQYAQTSAEELPYFNMTFLANVLGVRTYGNDAGILYTFANNQTLRVKKDSCSLMIDDCPVSLRGVVRFSGGNVYLPVEFLLRYTEGASISFSRTAGKLTLTFPKGEAALVLLPAEESATPHPNVI